MNATIYFTVTNDLNYDQRMQRICQSLSSAGYKVVLIGRRLKNSRPLPVKPYFQKRLYCLFTKGILFYTEFNLRLFFFLLFQKIDAICAIDLDTVLPVLFISKIKKIKRIYDAHELFTEMKEIKSRKNIHAIWNLIERYTLPQFQYGYTVCDSIASEFKKKYNCNFLTIRNVPTAKQLPNIIQKDKILIYTGAVNEGRGFEVLIPAMRFINYKLIVCGDGNFVNSAKLLASKYNVKDKIIFKGMLSPSDLQQEVEKAYIGINLVENYGLNQYYSLPNKFFDYIQAAIPQISMNYPEYKKINDQYHIAILLNDLNIQELANAVNLLMEDIVLYTTLKKNTLVAREVLTWENEEKKLLEYYNTLM